MATLTHSYSSDLRIDLKKWTGETFQTVYSDFMIDEKRWSYKLRYSECLGPGADGLNQHKDAIFHAKDQGSLKSTAVYYHGGWWYSANSRVVNLNSKYYDSEVGSHDGIKWVTWFANTLKEAKMMIRWNGKGRYNYKPWVSSCFTYRVRVEGKNQRERYLKYENIT